MTSTLSINAAADVILRAMQQGRTLPTAFAYALDSAGLLVTPEIAVELVELRKLPEQLREALAGAAVADDLYREWQQRAERAEARVAELEAAAAGTRTVDEDPIAYSLTPEALHASSGAVIEIPPRAEDVSRQVTQLRGLLARQRAAVEDPHDSPLHHDYRKGRDLPEHPYGECPSCAAPADATGCRIPAHRDGCPQAVTS